MYVNISYGRGFKGIIEYQLESKEKDQARMIGGNVLGTTEEIKRQFSAAAAENTNVRKPVAHIIVAWHPDDKVDDQVMAGVGERLLSSLEVEGDDHQFIMVRHEDEPHPHMHLVVNRVGLEGKVLENKRKPYLRLREEANRLEEEHDFTPAVSLAERARRVSEKTSAHQESSQRPEIPQEELGFTVGREVIIPPTAAQIPVVRRVSQGEPLGGRQEMHLKKMEERTGFRSAKHQVYKGVLAAIDRADGTWESLDSECRAEGIAPSWSFNRQGEFNGASFTLMSDANPHEAEVGPHGGTYTFKGSQLGPHGGLNREYLSRVMEQRSGTIEAQERRAERTAAKAENTRLLVLARQLRRTTSQTRHVIGPHLGRGLQWGKASYRTPLAGRTVSSLLKLFDSKRLGIPQTRRTPPTPTRRPRR